MLTSALKSASAFVVFLVISLSVQAKASSHIDLQQRTATSVQQHYSLTTVRNKCINFSKLEPEEFQACRVYAFGEIGIVAKKTLYYAIYCLTPDRRGNTDGCHPGTFTSIYDNAIGVAIFVRDSFDNDNVRLLIDRVRQDNVLTGHFQKPEIVQNASGTILYLSIREDGTGNINLSEYFLWDGKNWRPIDALSWLNDLSNRVPPRCEIRKGVWPDVRTMKATVELQGKGNLNYCASGEYAHLRLSIRGRKFIITSIDVNDQLQ